MILKLDFKKFKFGIKTLLMMKKGIYNKYFYLKIKLNYCKILFNFCIFNFFHEDKERN